MRFRLLLGAAAVVGVALPGSVGGATGLPYLRAVSVSNGRVVASVTLGEMVPGRIVVASSPRTRVTGAFLPANVRLTEPIGREPDASGRLAMRTTHRLPSGRYWVEVSARPGGLDCLPVKPCAERWSNVRLLVIPASG